MVRLWFANTLIQLSWQEMLKFFPRAFYSMPSDINEALRQILYFDPVFKIEKIFLREVFDKGAYIYTRFERAKDIKIGGKRWRNYHIIQPSSVPGEKYSYEGQLHFMELPIDEDKVKTIEKVKNYFQNEILLTPLLGAGDISNSVFQRIPKNGYRLVLHNNDKKNDGMNDDTNAEMTMDNDSDSQKNKRSRSKRRLKIYIERFLVCSSPNESPTTPFSYKRIYFNCGNIEERNVSASSSTEPKKNACDPGTEQLPVSESHSSSSTMDVELSEIPLETSNDTVEQQTESEKPSTPSILNAALPIVPLETSNDTVEQQTESEKPSTPSILNAALPIVPLEISNDTVEQQTESEKPSTPSILNAALPIVKNEMTNSPEVLKKIDNAVNMVLHKLEPVPIQTSDSIVKFGSSTSTSMDTNHVIQLKTYLNTRNLMDVTYTVECNFSKPHESSVLSYYCSIKFVDKVISDSFPNECLTPEQAMQVAAERALSIIKAHDRASLTLFFSNVYNS